MSAFWYGVLENFWSTNYKRLKANIPKVWIEDSEFYIPVLTRDRVLCPSFAP